MPWTRRADLLRSSAAETPGEAPVFSTILTTGAEVEEDTAVETLAVDSESFENAIRLLFRRTPKVEAALRAVTTGPAEQRRGAAEFVRFEQTVYAIRSVVRLYPNRIRITAERQS